MHTPAGRIPNAVSGAGAAKGKDGTWTIYISTAASSNRQSAAAEGRRILFDDATAPRTVLAAALARRGPVIVMRGGSRPELSSTSAR